MPPEADWLPARRRSQAGSDPRQSGARRNLEDAERGNGVPPSVIPNQNDMHGIEARSDECEQIATVEVREAFRGNREEIETEDGGRYSGVNPETEPASPEDPKKQRDEDDAGAGDKTGLRGSGVLQASGLESVAGKHKEAEGGAGKQFFPFQRSKHARAERGHEEGSQRESGGEKDEDRRIGEGVLDDDKGCAPKQAAESEGKIGPETFCHERRSCGEARASVYPEFLN